MTAKVYSEHDFRRNARRVLVFMEGRDGQRWAMQPVKFERVSPGQFIDYSSVEDEGEEFLQAFLDHAWEIGLRPKGFDDRTREVAAMGKHLDDMRHLVFKKNPLDK